MVTQLTADSVITEQDKKRVRAAFEARGIRWQFFTNPGETYWNLASRHQFLAHRYDLVLRALDLDRRGLPNPHLGKWIVRPRSKAHPNPTNENGGEPLTVAQILQDLKEGKDE
jgi:hypothetical protein